MKSPLETQRRETQVTQLADALKESLDEILPQAGLNGTNRKNVATLFHLAFAHMLGVFDAGMEALADQGLGPDEDTCIAMAMVKTFRGDFLDSVEDRLQASWNE